MNDDQKIQKFVQDVYLTRFNRFVDGIATSGFETADPVTDEDALTEIYKTLAYTNLWLDELEQEADSNGRPMNWSFVRENDVEIGEITAVDDTFELDEEQLRLVVDENRPLRLSSDGAVIATFTVVEANQITAKANETTDDQVTVVNKTLVFSRAFTDEEIGSTVIADIINAIPRLTTTDATTLDTVIPYQLMVLGVAKNATLPDIVQGGLSPSFVQKYSDLLDGVKMSNNNSSSADEMARDNLGYIGGVF